MEFPTFREMVEAEQRAALIAALFLGVEGIFRLILYLCAIGWILRHW